MAEENSKVRLGFLDVQDFTAAQNEAMLDLLVLAMYLDGNLAKVEEARVQQLLTAMGYASAYDRGKAFDASVTRIRRQSQTEEAVAAFAARLAGNFTAADKQRRVYEFWKELTALDGSVSSEESKFLTVVRGVFGI
jgi:Tellurite resistance protein TerB